MNGVGQIFRLTNNKTKLNNILRVKNFKTRNTTKFSSFSIKTTLINTTKTQKEHSSLYNFNSKPLIHHIRYTSSLPSGNIISFNLADVGEGIRECEVVKWSVSEGQRIHQFEKLCELLSDKASVEITSRYDGIIRKIHYKVGQIALVGKPLIDIELFEDNNNKVNDNKEELKENNNEINNNNNNNNNKIEEINEEEIIEIEEREETKEEIEAQEYQMIDSRGGPVKIMAAPSVRRIARSFKINLLEVKPTGKHGRILKEDILLFLSQPRSPLPSPSSTCPFANKKNKKEEIVMKDNTIVDSIEGNKKEGYSKEDKEVVIKGIQKQMVKSMTAVAAVPHFGYREEIIVDELIKVRNILKPLAEEKKIKLSYLPFFLKACSIALKDFPILNAHVNSDASTITYKANHNIGVAMDTSSGLLVPNIKNVQDKTILEIAQEINRLQNLGKEGKISLSDLKGGTITLSNIGNIGGTYAAPVLFLPEVAIAAIGRIQRVPRFDSNNNPFPVNFVNISWSADHRVVDGATMARFVAKLKFLLENPITFLAALK